MDIFLIVLIILLVVKMSSGRNSQNDYLSKDYMTNIRGLMAFSIVLHHISCYTSQKILFTKVMSHFGYLFVAVFFFLSGYGLMSKYKVNHDYLKDFWGNRILKNGIVLAIINLICNIEWITLGKKIRWIAPGAWYLLTLIIFYITFYLVFRICQDKHLNGTGIITSIVVLYVVFCCIIQKMDYWCFSNLAFPVGMIWALNKPKIDKVLYQHWYIILFISLAAFAAVSSVTLFFYTTYIYTFTRLLSSSIFVVILIILGVKIRFNNPIFKFLGRYSLGVYLFHMLVYTALRCQYVYIQNDILWTLLTILITMLFAIGFDYLMKGISSVLKVGRSTGGKYGQKDNNIVSDSHVRPWRRRKSPGESRQQYEQ